MKVIDILKKWAIKVEKKQSTLFTFDIEKQKSYLRHFEKPSDDIERSFNQYKCQMRLSGIGVKIFANVISIFMFGIFFLKYKSKTSNDEYKAADVVAFLDGKPQNILPLQINKEYKNIVFEEDESSYSLNNKDIEFLKQIIKRHPFSWYFLFKNMMKVAKYRHVINKYSPKALLVCAEYSFTSSVLTSYCEINNVLHINVMHGEKLFYMRDSFFRFHQCYIWDDYYKNLFIQLRADNNQFTVAIPKSIKFDSNNESAKLYDYTYYLASESNKELGLVNGLMKLLSNKGYTIAIRPHPRHTNFMFVETLFKEFHIEKCNEVTIEESILRTKNAISLYSTVLNQAFFNNVGVVIDDVTNPVKYIKLSELMYINVSKEHMLLSKLISK